MVSISIERLEVHFSPSQAKELEHPELKAVYVLPNREKAATFVAEKILEVVKDKPNAAISFPTGNQAKSVYEQLARIAKERGVSFADVKAYHLDEYFPITADHPDSFRKYLRENVWVPLGIKPENIHEIPADPGSDGDTVAVEYEKLLTQQEIDLVLHPIGCGGHMGFNESGTPKNSLTHLAALSPETIYRDHIERNQTSPNQAITQGIATIQRAKHIICIDFDPKYKDVMNEALYGPISEQNPSSLLREVGHKVTAVTTQEIINRVQ